MLTTITIPRPHVPYGPDHVTEDQADADYLRSAVRNIDHLSRGERIWGSNVTATVRKVLLDAADTLAAPPATPGRDVAQLVRDLIDPDDCWFDHQGGCQAHGYLSLQPGEMCPHAEAKLWLAGVADA